MRLFHSGTLVCRGRRDLASLTFSATNLGFMLLPNIIDIDETLYPDVSRDTTICDHAPM